MGIELMHRPADHLASKTSKPQPDHNQPSGQDAGGVGGPDLVRPFNDQTAKAVGLIGPPWLLSVVATRYLERCRAGAHAWAMRLRLPGQPNA